MRIARIYTPQALASHQQIELDTAPAHHLARVLRARVGDVVTLFNGEGGEFSATLTIVDKRTVVADIGEFCVDDRQSPLQTTLGIAISKGERMDWVVQKATELGVTQIQPLLTERVEVKLKGDRLEKKIQHWQQVAISACEQSARNQIPAVAEPIKLDQWLDRVNAECKLVLHHRSSGALTDLTPPSSVALLIGPEGGLSSEEIESAEHQGFAPLTLGPRVLRTETAPIAALTLLQYLWGDF